jgi:hypothetical protein
MSDLSGAHSRFKLFLPVKCWLLPMESCKVHQGGPGVIEHREKDFTPEVMICGVVDKGI